MNFSQRPGLGESRRNVAPRPSARLENKKQDRSSKLGLTPGLGIERQRIDFSLLCVTATVFTLPWLLFGKKSRKLQLVPATYGMERAREFKFSKFFCSYFKNSFFLVCVRASCVRCRRQRGERRHPDGEKLWQIVRNPNDTYRWTIRDVVELSPDAISHLCILALIISDVESNKNRSQSSRCYIML